MRAYLSPSSDNSRGARFCVNTHCLSEPTEDGEHAFFASHPSRIRRHWPVTVLVDPCCKADQEREKLRSQAEATKGMFRKASWSLRRVCRPTERGAKNTLSMTYSKCLVAHSIQIKTCNEQNLLNCQQVKAWHVVGNRQGRLAQASHSSKAAGATLTAAKAAPGKECALYTQ